MAKHGKNSTACPVYSNHERKRDARESCFGTQELRLSADSARPLDSCALSNQKCRDPVITSEGYIFEKEAILEYFLKQKQLNKLAMKLYKKQLIKYKKAKELEKEAEKDEKITKFKRANETIGSHQNEVCHEKNTIGVSNMSSENKSVNPSFWLKHDAKVESEITKPKLPDTILRCPVKDLMDVKFNLSEDGKSHICPITGDVINNTIPCVYLKTTGNIITKACVDKIIKGKKNDPMVCPLTGTELSETDLIEIKIGGSSFSASNKKLIAKIVKPVMTVT